MILFFKSRSKSTSFQSPSSSQLTRRPPSSDVLASLNYTKSLFASHTRIYHLTSYSADNPELQQSHSDIENTLTELGATLEDLSDSVRETENDPYRYGIELDELGRRRQWVTEVMQEIENMKDQLRKMNATTIPGDRARTSQRASSSQLPNPSNFENIDDAQQDDPDYFVEFEQQQQLGIIADQNQQLDDVSLTVGRLRQQANTVGLELGDQSHMLMDVEQATERVGDKLKGGARAIGDVLRRNEGGIFWMTDNTAQASLLADTRREQILHPVAALPSSYSY